MRIVAIVLLVACSKSSSGPTPPDPASYQKMTLDERCAATAPRGVGCIDQVMMEQARSLGLPEVGSAQIRIPATAETAQKMYRVTCSRGPAFPDAVYACWSRPTCDAFAKCVVAAEAHTPAK